MIAFLWHPQFMVSAAREKYTLPWNISLLAASCASFVGLLLRTICEQYVCVLIRYVLVHLHPLHLVSTPMLAAAPWCNFPCFFRKGQWHQWRCVRALASTIWRIASGTSKALVRSKVMAFMRGWTGWQAHWRNCKLQVAYLLEGHRCSKKQVCL